MQYVHKGPVTLMRSKLAGSPDAPWYTELAIGRHLVRLPQGLLGRLGGLFFAKPSSTTSAAPCLSSQISAALASLTAGLIDPDEEAALAKINGLPISDADKLRLRR